jgi:ribosome-associated heat shock protein Hsp15
VDSARVDQWLWAVRILPTRTQATAACRAGHVHVNGSAAKAATPVRPGDRVALRHAGRQRELVVVEAIAKRVGAARAAECLEDRSPPAPKVPEAVFARDPGAGRPTKRDRRRLDRLRD